MSTANRPVFFIDWCLGKTVAQALVDADAQIERHGEHFAQDALDIDWLSVVGARGWVVLTKDQAIGKNRLELRAIAEANVKVFTLVSGNLTRQQMAALFVEGLEKLEGFTMGNPSPFIAKFYKDGRIQLWRNKTQLLKLLNRDEELP